LSHGSFAYNILNKKNGDEKIDIENINDIYKYIQKKIIESKGEEIGIIFECIENIYLFYIYINKVFNTNYGTDIYKKENNIYMDENYSIGGGGKNKMYDEKKIEKIKDRDKKIKRKKVKKKKNITI